MKYTPLTNYLNKHLTFGMGEKGYYEKDIIEAEKKFIEQFKDQLKEKADEIEKIKIDFINASSSYKLLESQLTKSNEMNENMSELLRNANDNSDRLEKWGNELQEKLNRATSAMTKTVQTLAFHGLKSNELNDFLNELKNDQQYQNTKK